MEGGSCAFKEVSQHFPGGTEETMKYIGQDSRPSAQESNPEPPEYEAGMPTNQLHY
jgi:hypothetical protein